MNATPPSPRTTLAHALPLAPVGFLRKAGVALLVAALVLVLMSQFTDLDVALADRSFDTVLHRFAWRDTWFADAFMHRWVKLPLIVLGSVLVLVALVEAVLQRPRLGAANRWRLRVSALIALIVPLVISLVKHQSASHCPWGIDRYGGNAPHLRLLDSVPAGFELGGCFPAGHASSALWLAGLCVWWLPRRPRMAAAVFAAGLAAGFALGWVQQMRGAHFLSHTLWSIWITAAVIWTVLFGLALVQRARLRSRPVAAPNTTAA